MILTSICRLKLWMINDEPMLPLVEYGSWSSRLAPPVPRTPRRHVMEAHRGPRASRSKKNLPAAFQGPKGPRHGSDRSHSHTSHTSHTHGVSVPPVQSPRVPEHRPSDGEVEVKEVDATIRLNSLVFLSSCPQRHGHFAIKKMLHPSTLELFCLMEIPGSDHQRAHLKSWLHAWLTRWSRLQAQHPGLLVALREAFWDAPQGYPMAILCEYMPLGSLHDLIQACGGLPEEATREIAISVLQALDVLHSAEPPVVHGCVKPSQVLFSTSGRPRLTFGLEQRIKTCQTSAASDEFPGEQTEQTVVDIFDLGLLLLVSALGGMEVLLDAIPYARSCSQVDQMVSPRGDTRELLLHELRGATPEAPGEIGYLPAASDLLFNRRYSGPFLAFVSTCLEAHSQNPPVRAGDLLCHEFLQTHAESEGPLITLREMQSLARILNEAPEDPSRLVSSTRRAGPSSSLGPGGVAPSVAQSAQLYLMNIAQSIAPHWKSYTSQTPRRTLDTRGKEWETLLTDTARTLGLSRQVVHAALEAQVERILTARWCHDSGRFEDGNSSPCIVDHKLKFVECLV